MKIRAVKVVSKFLAFALAVTLTSSCFEKPSYSPIPEIELVDYYILEDIVYGNNEIAGDYLFIKLSFKDGDGDLGIPKIQSTDGSTVDNFDDPFHERNFYMVDPSNPSVLRTVSSVTFYTDTLQNGLAQFVPLTILTPGNQTGKLLTIRNQYGFSGNQTLPSMPDLDPDFINCLNYTNDTLFVYEDDWHMIDDSYSQDNDTIRDAFGNHFITLADTLYYTPNPNYNNFEIDFFVNGVEYDWREEFCASYDGRFSVLSEGSTALEGEILYGIPADFFGFIFTTKKLVLKVRIRDRALNESNIISTPEFVLSDIVRPQ